MTHRFAARLDVSLEFVHIKSTQDLISGYCDVFFDSLALNPDRAEFSASTAPFNQITVAFVVPHQRRDQFAT